MYVTFVLSALCLVLSASVGCVLDVGAHGSTTRCAAAGTVPQRVHYITLLTAIAR